jgi:hypothetical protein
MPYLKIADRLTNILLSSGSIGVEESAVSDKVLIGDMRTDIGRTSSGYIAVETDGTFSRYATIGDSVTNIPLNSSGAMIVTADSGEDEKVFIQDIRSDMGRKNGKIKIATGSSFYNFMGPTNSNGFTTVTASPDVIYSTLLSDAAVTSPLVGGAGTVVGSITYDAAGGDIDANGKYFCFPWVPANAGTWEVEWTPHFDSTSVTNAYILDDNAGATRVLGLYQASTEIAFGRAGGLAETSGLSFATDSTNTLKLVWDTAGIEGGPNIHEFYFNGVLDGFSTVALSAVTETDLRLGNNSGDTLFANAKMRNLKIWSTAIRP